MLSCVREILFFLFCCYYIN